MINYLLTARQPWCGLWLAGPEIIQDRISNSTAQQSWMEYVRAQGLYSGHHTSGKRAQEQQKKKVSNKARGGPNGWAERNR